MFRGKAAQQHRTDRNRHHDLAPVGGHILEWPDQHPREERDCGDLGCRREEGGDRRRRTFVNVWRPHVEGDG
jgi:hypothetical protein